MSGLTVFTLTLHTAQGGGTSQVPTGSRSREGKNIYTSEKPNTVQYRMSLAVVWRGGLGRDKVQTLRIRIESATKFRGYHGLSGRWQKAAEGQSAGGLHIPE